MSKGAALMETEILDEIRKVRDEHAKECGYDVHRAFEQMRAETSDSRKKAGTWSIAPSPARLCGKSRVRVSSGRRPVRPALTGGW